MKDKHMETWEDTIEGPMFGVTPLSTIWKDADLAKRVVKLDHTDPVQSKEIHSMVETAMTRLANTEPGGMQINFGRQ